MIKHVIEIVYPDNTIMKTAIRCSTLQLTTAIVVTRKIRERFCEIDLLPNVKVSVIIWILCVKFSFLLNILFAHQRCLN